MRRASSELEVYDADTLILQRHLVIKGLVWPTDMTSSDKFKCLYISDGGYISGTNRFIHRVEPNGKTIKWPTVDIPFSLSVSLDMSNVIVIYRETRKLKEFTTNGVLKREVDLPEVLVNASHAVQLPSGRIVVSHGDGSDEITRVCLLEDGGRVTKCYGDRRGSGEGQLNFPIRLTVDQDGSILIIDVNNKRVLRLSASLDDVTEIISRSDIIALWYPYRMYLQTMRRRVFIAECQWDGQNKTWINGELLTYRIN